MTKAPHSTRFAWIAAASLLVGCASGPPVAAQTAARRSNVAPPSISVAALPSAVMPLSRSTLTAATQGGEAMLFTVDWRVAEGDAGGKVESARRVGPGSYEATYVAPQSPGTYHVIATIREFPAATTSIEVRVADR